MMHCCLPLDMRHGRYHLFSILPEHTFGSSGFQPLVMLDVWMLGVFIEALVRRPLGLVLMTISIPFYSMFHSVTQIYVTQMSRMLAMLLIMTFLIIAKIISIVLVERGAPG
ncbi:hypothetical protein BDN72DRAFT_546450 [Pluteus cervinus]|uniref:Uncharacterized protein n=1 Tax=Pluteus cervinus TaxID=181527 RepID=A0ACD3AWY1_9AGAR|nr:hypothetical protein BDN72DRAFT_546450 [Pluteus cervinus]